MLGRILMTLQALVCTKLRKAAQDQKLSQAALGRLLAAETGEKWPQSRVWKLLHAKLPVTIDMLAAAASVLHLSLLDLFAHATVQPKAMSQKRLHVLRVLEQERLLDDVANTKVAVIVFTDDVAGSGKALPTTTARGPRRGLRGRSDARTKDVGPKV
jgi:transcriptional regulator with XRE-family HTH domain